MLLITALQPPRRYLKGLIVANPRPRCREVGCLWDFSFECGYLCIPTCLKMQSLINWQWPLKNQTLTSPIHLYDSVRWWARFSFGSVIRSLKSLRPPKCTKTNLFVFRFYKSLIIKIHYKNRTTWYHIFLLLPAACAYVDINQSNYAYK